MNRLSRLDNETPRYVLSEDGVESLVTDLFLVVEGADVGRSESLDAVSESSCCLAEVCRPLDLSVWLANTIVGPLTIDVGYTPHGALQQLVAAVLPG